MQELFESSNGDFDIQKTHINDLGDYVITAGLSNNGILGKTDIKAKIFNANTITIDMFGNAFYRQFRYKMVTHARVFSLKSIFSITQRQGIFLSSAMYFLKYNFGYENMCSWAKIKQEKISLPVKKDIEIDFAFMEDFISQLEACRLSQLETCRLSQLETYLLVTGLKNYTLTPAEEQALTDFQNGKVKWGEFKVVDLFDVKTSKKRFDANKVKVLQVGYPYVVRTALNNGIKGFLNENKKYLNLGNTISFGQDTATIFYQEKPYFTGDKIKILEPKHKLFGKKNAQFIITVMEQSFRAFSWGSSSFSEEVIKTQHIYIPIQKEEINFEYMEILISAVQKLVIKDVVEYADRKIEATKKIINK